jgi:hypothetical protein
LAPPPPSAIRSVVEVATDRHPSASADHLLSPAQGRGYVLVGSMQSRPGERDTATLWVSADGVNWRRMRRQRSLAAGASSVAIAGVWHGRRLVIGGDITDDTGTARPALWTAAGGRRFGKPVDPFGHPGSVTALVSAPSDLIAGGVVRSAVGAATPVVARRTASSWTLTRLPLGRDREGRVLGVAVRGRTVAAVGFVGNDDNSRAAAWVSRDGGRTFRQARVTGLRPRAASELGAVVAGPDGFIAAACIERRDIQTTALATSVDGRVWKRVAIRLDEARGGPARELASACSSLVVRGGRALVGVENFGFPYVLDVALDGSGSALPAPSPRGPTALGSPLIGIRADGTIVAVTRDARGFSSGGVTGDFNPPTGFGLPVGRPFLAGLDLSTARRRLLIRAYRFPIILKKPGSFSLSERYEWATSLKGTSWSKAGVPPDAEVVRSGHGVTIALGARRNGLAEQAPGTQAWLRSALAGYDRGAPVTWTLPIPE